MSRRRRRSCARRCSASLLDAARHNVARGATGRARCSSPARCYRPERRARPAAPASRHARRRAADRRPRGRRAGASPSRRRPTSSRPRACSRAAARRAARRLVASSRASEPFLHPGRAAASAPAASGRLDRRAAPARRARSGSSTRRRRVRARPRRGRRSRARPGPTTRTSRRSPPCARTSPSSCPRRCPAGAVVDVVRAAGGPLLAAVEVFDVYAGEQVGEGEHVARAARSRSAPPTGRSPTRRSRERARADRRALRERARGRAPWLSVARRSAPPASPGALAAHAAATAIRASSSPPSPPQRAGRRLDDLYPRHRVPLVLEELDLDRARRRLDAAIVAYPHGAAAPRRRGAARARRAGRRSSAPTSACATRDVYERWYGDRTRRPELLDEAVYGLTELLPRRDRAAPTSSPTPAASRPPRCSRSRRWRAPG